ncbi:hypothetical protein K501DRAFT_336747 [Backusella circina FSU 941]|nr:hypothetical protein K501DRAFT_336747 [Backusella circina FSU 941]
MKRPTWQFHLLLFAILSLLSAAVDASYIGGDSIEKREVTPTPAAFKHHATKHHHKHPKIHTVTVNNCTASAIQNKLLRQSKKINGTKTSTAIPTLPAIITMRNHTSTVFVCHKTKHAAEHHHSTKKHHSSKHHTTTKHVSKKDHRSTKKHHSSKKPASSKKEDKHPYVSKNKKHTTKKHRTTTTTATTTTTHSKKKTTIKSTHKTKKTTTTKAHKKHTTTKVATTTTLEFVPASLPTTARVISSGDNSSNDNADTYEEPIDSTTPEATTPDATTPAAATTTPDNDTNNQVTAQSVNQEKSVDAEPQSKVVGVSVGAVVGCIAAAGLAGMFIYKRKQKNAEEQDVEYNDSNVNTRWKTQSFMAVVAGAVAKLPNRSNSQTSQRSVGVLGSIRRAVSNASSFRSNNRSSQQSYGTATSDPLPPLARIDGDQARYYNEPTSPTEHTHAY